MNPLRRRLNAWRSSPLAGPFLIMLGIAGLVALTTDRFLDRQNLINVSLQVAIVALVAIGATIVIVTAQIDLSSGSLVALTTVIMAGIIKSLGLPVSPFTRPSAAPINNMSSTARIFSSYGRIPSFIFTLGTLSIFRGLAFLYTGGTPIFSVSPRLNPIFYGRFLGLSYPFIYVVLLYTLAHLYLRYTEGGRQMYAVGGNESAARLSGISVNRVRTKAFVIAGTASALGGVLLTARLDSGSPNYGVGMELMAIAAAVIGGASLFGGQGHIVATLFGALTIVIVQNGLNLNAVPAAWQNITLGIIIAAAVGVDMWRGELGHLLGRVAGRNSPHRPGEEPGGEPQELEQVPGRTARPR